MAYVKMIPYIASPSPGGAGVFRLDVVRTTADTSFGWGARLMFFPS